VGTVLPLVRDGLRLRTSAGQEVRVRGIDAYSAVNDILIGETNRLGEYFDWARGVGISTLRVFNLWGNLDLSPRRHGYYDALRAVIDLALAYGHRPWLVRYCDQVDGSPVYLNARERAEYDRTLPLIYGDLPIDEYMNEPWQNGNFAGSLSRIGTLLATRGAANDSQLPSAPGALLDFTTHHTPRGDQQTRKAKELIDVAKLGFEGWPPSMICALAGEPPHINKDEWTDPQLCADYYALCDLYGNGGVIHGGYAPDGSNAPLQSCVIPTDANTLACLDAIATVWRDGNDVPLGTFADGKYLRGTAMNDGDLGIDHYDRYTDFGENPEGSLRTFAMQVGSRQIVAPVDRGPQWALGTTIGFRHGYRLVEARGRHGNILILDR